MAQTPEEQGKDQKAKRRQAMIAWQNAASTQAVAYENIAVTLAKDFPHLAMLAESAAVMVRVFANALERHLT